MKAFKYQTLSITLLAVDLVAEGKPSILCKEQTDEGVARVEALEIQISTSAFVCFPFKVRQSLAVSVFPL